MFKSQITSPFSTPISAASADSTVLLTAASLSVTWLQQLHVGGNGEVPSEMVGWLLVLAWSALPFRWTKSSMADHALGFHPWIISGAVVTLAMGRSMVDVRWIQPLLVPSLAVIRRHSPHHAMRWRPPSSRYLPVWILTPAAFFSSVALVGVGESRVWSFAMVVSCFLAMMALFTSLISLFETPDFDLCRTHATRLMQSVSLRILALLVVGYFLRIHILHTPPLSPFIVAGLMKGINWILLFHITQNTVWDIAPAIDTFSAASSLACSPVASPWTAFARAITAAMALLQTISLLPYTRLRHFLLIFLLAPILPRVYEESLSRGGRSYYEMKGPGASESHSQPGKVKHPIEQLVRDAQTQFDSMVRRQSKTYEQAVTAYKRRHKMDPPPGFDQWYTYAVAQDSVIIDDFDTISDSLAPFWQVPPKELRRMMTEANSDVRVGRFRSRNGTFLGDEEDRARALAQLMEPIARFLPDMDFLVNNLDEPRVLPSTEAKDLTLDVFWEDHGGENITSLAMAPCTQPWQSSRRASLSITSDAVNTLGLPFIKDIAQARDICQHADYGNMHGIFIAPASMLTTKQALPILSEATLSTFSDILYPSPWYAHLDEGWLADADMGWENKSATVYWAGRTTGALANDNSTWPHLARQRFVTLARHLDHNATSRFLRETSAGTWEAYDSTGEVEKLQTLYDVKFTSLVQCSETQCAAQKSYFGIQEQLEAEDRQFAHRLLMDLDGNSYSGRFYSHLKSRSVSLKTTIFREWHDDRLVPWLHYVPVSLSLAELPETVRFLARTPAGDRVARLIAESGRDWALRVLRVADFRVYFYRQALEMHRLLHENRPTIKPWSPPQEKRHQTRAQGDSLSDLSDRARALWELPRTAIAVLTDRWTLLLTVCG